MASSENISPSEMDIRLRTTREQPKMQIMCKIISGQPDSRGTEINADDRHLLDALREDGMQQ
jgi:hypothetical protein